MGVRVSYPSVARDCTVKKTQYSKLKLGAAPLVLSVALVSVPAFAQDAEGAAAEKEIVVTGSLIRNPNLEQSTPVNVTTSDAIELKQSNVAEEVLRELPGVVPNMGSAGHKREKKRGRAVRITARRPPG